MFGYSFGMDKNDGLKFDHILCVGEALNQNIVDKLKAYETYCKWHSCRLSLQF